MKISNNIIFIQDIHLQKQYYPSDYYEHVGAATALRFVSIPDSVVLEPGLS